ncbi:hypothetical protein J1614_011316 [Plenodomus biglobosus]|nr:hypothetical protein J1614_011316 [Plenodomus biglobosus]
MHYVMAWQGATITTLLVTTLRHWSPGPATPRWCASEVAVELKLGMYSIVLAYSLVLYTDVLGLSSTSMMRFRYRRAFARVWWNTGVVVRYGPLAPGTDHGR